MRRKLLLSSMNCAKLSTVYAKTRRSLNAIMNGSKIKRNRPLKPRNSYEKRSSLWIAAGKIVNRDHCAHSGYKLISKRLLKKTFFSRFLPFLLEAESGSKQNPRYERSHLMLLFYEWMDGSNDQSMKGGLETNLNIYIFLTIFFAFSQSSRRRFLNVDFDDVYGGLQPASSHRWF